MILIVLHFFKKIFSHYLLCPLAMNLVVCNSFLVVKYDKMFKDHPV